MEHPVKKHTGTSYDETASKYADLQDAKPWNIYFERPGVLRFLPDMQGKDVLDAGCGPGFYSLFGVNQGASVTAVDFNAEFVRRTKERTGNRAKVLQADLAEPLSFAQDASFDVIISVLVLHYLKDWLPTLREFFRVLRPNGQLIFATHHPFTDMELSPTGDYFAVDLIEDEWDIGKVQYYRRPLSKISKDLFDAGFVIEEISEPQPIKPPEGIVFSSYEKAMTSPRRLLIRATKVRG